MAGLELTDAVRSYQQGAAWRVQKDEADRQQKRQALIDEANNTAAQAVKTAEQEDYAKQRQDWINGGGDNAQFQPKPFQPPDSMMFKIANERGVALMKAGMIPEAVQNEALVQQQRLRLRQSALEKFRATGGTDYYGLAKSMIDTMPGLPPVKSVEVAEGAPGSDGKGAIPAMAEIPSKVRITLADDTVHEMTPDELKNTALQLSDGQLAQHEAAANLARIKAQAEADAKKQEIAARGEEDRKTEAVRGKNALTLENVRLGGQKEIHAADREVTREVGLDRNEAMRYAANQRLEGVQYRAENPAGGKEGSNGLQRTFADSEGFMVGTFRDGTTRRLLDEKGKPVRSQEWSKRVDSVAKTLREAPGNYSKSPDELRQLAIQNLSRGYSVPGSTGSSPGLGDAAAPKVNFLGFEKK